jgi:hypothetical protein
MTDTYKNICFRDQLFASFIDKGFKQGYTFSKEQLKNRLPNKVLSGLFCRGSLPEYQWMNIPEAFLFPHIMYRKFFERKSL